MDDGDSEGGLTGTDDARRPPTGADGDGVGPGVGSGPSGVRIAEGTDPRAIVGGGLAVCLATAGALVGAVSVLAPAGAILLAGAVGGVVGNRNDDPVTETLLAVAGGSAVGAVVGVGAAGQLPGVSRAAVDDRLFGVLAAAVGTTVVACVLAVAVSAGIDWYRDRRGDHTPEFVEK